MGTIDTFIMKDGRKVIVDWTSTECLLAISKKDMKEIGKKVKDALKFVQSDEYMKRLHNSFGIPYKTTKEKQAEAKQILESSGLEFKKTALGQAAFVPKGTKGKYADKILFPDDWSASQFEAMAHYMRTNPNCTIFSDGSGNPCKL